jgi:hypothetical protein
MAPVDSAMMISSASVACRIGMVWHDSLHDNPAQRWLRATVAKLCAQL